jgi:putative hemolysin
MSAIAAEALVVLALLLVNGIFAMSEMAIVSSRRLRLQRRAERGDAGARAALRLVEEPARFLSAVQVGITLVGILLGAFGGATIAGNLAAAFARVPVLAPHADGVALATVVIGITYLSLVIGELVPKRIALTSPERIASIVAPAMRLVARVASPLVTLLTGSSNLVLRLLGVRLRAGPSVTEEEIRALVEEGTESGVVQAAEQELVESVFRLGDRQAASIMTPRTDLEWLDVADPPDELRARLADGRAPSVLVVEGGLENVLGVVQAEDLLARVVARGALELPGDLRRALNVLASTPIYALLDRFRKARPQVAIVLDEYGGVEGLVTLDDIVEALVGDVVTGAGAEAPAIVRRPDGGWLMDGTLPIEDVVAEVGLDSLPAEKRRGFRTLAGFVLSQLGHVPQPGEHTSWGGMRFEVVDMDGRRIDKLLIMPEPQVGDGDGGADHLGDAS